MSCWLRAEDASCLCGGCIADDITLGVARASMRATRLIKAGRWPVGSDAHKGLSPGGGPGLAVVVGNKLPPLKCQKCEYVNDYAGPEHLVAGLYYCRNHIAKAKERLAQVTVPPSWDGTYRGIQGYSL